MKKKPLIQFTRHCIASKDKRYVAIDPDRVSRIIDAGSYTAIAYSPREVFNVEESFSLAMEIINAGREPYDKR